MENQILQELVPVPVEYTFVNAGAGAGKTTNLVAHIVDQYVTFKKTQGRSPRIIGTTFTRKAANEIKERVAGQYVKYDPNNAHLLSEQELQNPNREFIQAHLEDLLDFAYSESLNITTIHGICLQIITKKAYLLGYSPSLRIVAEQNISFAKKRILYKYMEQEKYERLYQYFSFAEIIKLLDLLNQKKELIKRPANLEDLDKIYLDLMEEIKTQTQQIQNIDPNQLGSFGAQTEKVKLYISNIKQGLKLSLDQGDLSALASAYESMTGSAPSPRGKLCDPQALVEFAKFRDEVKFLDGFLKDGKYSKYFDKSYYKLVVEISDLVFLLYREYHQELREHKRHESLVSMNDVEELALEILQKFPEDCQDFIDMWDYWYIDEYQDTSPIQAQIFEILLKNKSYYKVGDPQQSIYLFRGAESSLFTKEWEEAKASDNILDRILNINYRSHPNLMAGMNEFFAHLEEASSEFEVSFSPMQSSKEVEHEDEPRLSLNCFADPEKEMRFVADKISELIASGISPKNICILARSKSILMDYEAEFARLHIPSVAQFSGGLSSRPEVQGLRTFLSVMNNPHEDLDLIALLRTQNFKVEDDVLYKWSEEYRNQKNWSLWERIKENPHPSVQKIKEFYFFFKEKDYVQGLKKYFSETLVLNSAYGGIDLARRKANLLKLYSYLCQKSENSNFTLQTILDELDNEETTEELQSEAVFSESQDGVRLFTIHGSKGLEFEYVFLVASGRKGKLDDVEDVELLSEEGLFVIPVTHADDRERKSTVLRFFSHRHRILAQKKEIRRVIYVAATRAKEKLFITGAVSLKKAEEGGSANRVMYGQDNSLFKIIDIESFVQNNWKHISVQTNLEEAKETEKEKAFKHLVFGLKSEDFTLDLVKNIYLKTELNRNLRREATVNPMSVSKVVEWFEEKEFLDFSFNEICRLSITKVNLGDFINHEKKAFNPMMVQFLKPYVGDLFHKSVELFSKEISEEDLKYYLKNFFSHGSEEVYKLIKEISEIQKPDMYAILKTARPEWGFNSILSDKLLLSGQVDLWGMDKEGRIHIIDYKTGSSFHLKKAAFQLALYKEVLRLLYPDKEICTHVLYPTEGLFITVETSAIDISALV